MYEGDLTIEQALDAMKKGHKVANSHFTSNEWLTCEVMKGNYIDDNGCLVEDNVIFIRDESGYDFNEWFFDEDGLGGYPSFKNDGLCWRIVD